MDNAQKTVEQGVQELHLIRRQAGAVLEHDQRLQCLEHRLARLHSLTQLYQCISSSLHLDEVLHAIAQAAATLMQAPVASFWLANESTQTLEFHSCSAEPFHLDADDQYVLDHLSAQAAVAIRNARLYRDSENHRRRLMTLVDVTLRLTRGLDLSTVLQAMTIEKAGMLGVDAFLMKPLVIHDLGLAIQRVLASRRIVL
jgi:hypothetical protein